MSVIDQRADELNNLQTKMKKAPTFADFLQLQYEQYNLRVAMKGELVDLARLSQGWVFVPPRR